MVEATVLTLVEAAMEASWLGSRFRGLPRRFDQPVLLGAAQYAHFLLYHPGESNPFYRVHL